MHRIAMTAALLAVATPVLANEPFVGNVQPWPGGGYAVTSGNGSADIFHPPAEVTGFVALEPGFHFRLTFAEGSVTSAQDFARDVCNRIAGIDVAWTVGPTHLDFRCPG